MAFAVDFPDRYYREFIEAYTRKRDWLGGALSDLGFHVFMPGGTYYLNAGVAAIPCSYFWKDRQQGRNLARFCFCKKDETLEEAVRRLKTWLKKI